MHVLLVLYDNPENIMNSKIRNSHSLALPLLIMLILVCASQPACSSRPSAVPLEAPISEQPEEEAAQETITLNNETYIIPPPWAGNRLTPPELSYSDFLRIPEEYTHNGSKIYILATAHKPLVALLQAADKDGIPLKVESAYRSAGYQERIFKRMLSEGRSFEDIIRYVAPPGYSQHMLGTAVDFFPSNWQFADTSAYTWLRQNAIRFGFEETYSQFNPMKMPWEAWHWNFIGKRTDN